MCSGTGSNFTAGQPILGSVRCSPLLRLVLQLHHETSQAFPRGCHDVRPEPWFRAHRDPFDHRPHHPFGARAARALDPDGKDTRAMEIRRHGPGQRPAFNDAGPRRATEDGRRRPAGDGDSRFENGCRQHPCQPLLDGGLVEYRWKQLVLTNPHPDAPTQIRGLAGQRGEAGAFKPR